MDYFSELLESYTKLKKRTFKLTYINEQEEDPNAAAAKALDDSAGMPASDPYMIPGSQGALWQSRDGSAIGKWTFVKDLGKYRSNDERSTSVFNSPDDPGFANLRAFLSGEGEGSIDPAKKEQAKEEADNAEAADAARQEEIEELAAEAAPYHFGEKGANYSLDKNSPENVTRAVDATQRTMVGLNQYCDQYTDGKNTPVICGPTQKTRLISSKGAASFAYKLANAQVVTRDENGNPIEGEQQAPPGLVNDVAENHDAFMSFLYNPPTKKDKKERCEALNKQVGYHNGNLIVFGKDLDSEGTPTDGLTFSTKDNKLYQEAIAAVQKSCGNTWNPSRTYSSAVNKNAQGTNTIRGSILEKALVLAIVLDDPNATDEQKREAYRQLAEYAAEKYEDLLEISRRLYAGDEERTRDMMSHHEVEVLKEQGQLAEREGVEGVLRYLMESIQATRGFVKDLGANDAYDNSKGGGQGDRADTIAVFDTYEDALAGVRKVGLDEDAVREGTKGTIGEGRYEVGIGQKLKQDKTGAFKAGEVGSTELRRAGIRGERTDRKFYAGFYAWADNLQFGSAVDRPPAKERFDAFLEFEEDMELSISAVESAMVDGKIYIDSEGNIKSQSGEAICGSVARQITAALGYPPGQGPGADVTEQEIYTALLGKKDWSDASVRGEGAEALTRLLRTQTVKESVTDPEGYLEKRGELEGLTPEERQAKIARTKLAGQDWVVRNVILTGGDARDIAQLQTSLSEGETLSIDHNFMMREVCRTREVKEGEPPPPPYEGIEFRFDGFQMYVDKKFEAEGDLPEETLTVQLGQERTNAPKGSGKAKETRTVCTYPKGTAKSPRVAKKYKPGKRKRAKDQVVPEESDLRQFIRVQMELFEQFLNSSK